MLTERTERAAGRIRRFDDAYIKGVAWAALVLIAVLIAAAMLA